MSSAGARGGAGDRREPAAPDEPARVPRPPAACAAAPSTAQAPASPPVKKYAGIIHFHTGSFRTGSP